MRVSCYELTKGNLVTGVYLPVKRFTESVDLDFAPWLIVSVNFPYAGCINIDFLGSDGLQHQYQHTVERFYEVEL